MGIEAFGFQWPDTRKASAVLRDAGNIERWLAHTTGRRQCVQAGACVGVFPKALAAHFAEVWTVELAPDNFACLEANGMPANVYAHCGALGETPGKTGMQRERLPISHYVSAGNDLPVLTIDGWGLQECDLIALDVEGYEWPALKGAVDTIKRCSPLLVIETKGHGQRFGYTDAQMNGWIQGLGYRLVERVGRDNVWKHD